MAWCCYDWANSAYTTVLIAVFVVYIQNIVFAPEKWNDTGPVVWAWGIAASMLVGAILSPALGAIADATNSKRACLALTSIGGGLACIAMAATPPSAIVVVTGLFCLANLCLELSLPVYNGFLPEIASDDDLDSVSAAGMGAGYLGGGLALLFALLLLKFGDQLGIDNLTTRIRICIAGTGLWWIAFTIPTVLILKDIARDEAVTDRVSRFDGIRTAVGNSWRDAFSTLRQIRANTPLLLFLIAFLFFNDGVQTVFSQSSTFALQEIKLTENELAGIILMIQFLAVPGALLVGRASNIFGRKSSLVACLVVWVALLTSAWFVQSKTAYVIMAVFVALVLGGTQSVARAIMGSLIPAGQEAKYFGFFNLSGKATSFMGSFLFGLVFATTQSARFAIVAVAIFFVVGLVLLSFADLSAVEGGEKPEC